MKPHDYLDGDDLQTLPSFNLVESSLIDLVAETAIWVRPEKVGSSPIYPNVKRGASRDNGKVIDGIRIDNNTYANVAIKNAISKSIDFRNYTVCHIWPGTTYDEKYHTLLANLVLIPRILAGLSDFFPGVINVLKFRSWELYGWHPEGEDIPMQPSYYPKNWRSFIPNTNFRERAPSESYSLENDIKKEEYEQDKEANEIDKVHRKVPKWLNHPNQINTRILNLYMELSGNDQRAIKRDKLREMFELSSSDPFDSNFNQMKIFALKNHAKVFTEDINGYVRLWKPVASYIQNRYNTHI